MSDKFKLPFIKTPPVAVSPAQQQQSAQGSMTGGRIGAWNVNGPILQSGGIKMDASKPYILLNDGTTNRIVIGNV